MASIFLIAQFGKMGVCTQISRFRGKKYSPLIRLAPDQPVLAPVQTPLVVLRTGLGVSPAPRDGRGVRSKVASSTAGNPIDSITCSTGATPPLIRPASGQLVAALVQITLGVPWTSLSWCPASRDGRGRWPKLATSTACWPKSLIDFPRGIDLTASYRVNSAARRHVGLCIPAYYITCPPVPVLNSQSTAINFELSDHWHGCSAVTAATSGGGHHGSWGPV